MSEDFDVDSSTDDSSIDLTKDDKSLIKALMVREYFGKSEDSNNEEYFYKCKEHCNICSNNKPNFSIDDGYNKAIKQEGNLSILKEDREMIIRDLLHSFLNQKWEDKKTETALYDSKKHRPRSSKDYNKKKSVAVKKEYEKDFEHPNEEKHFVKETSENCKQELTLANTDPILGESRAHLGQEVTGSDAKSTVPAKVPAVSAETKPMDNPEGPFYINRSYVNVRLYQDGLKNRCWNPTQALYEFCASCGWNSPDYTIIRTDFPMKVIPSFVCKVVLNGQSFMSDRPASQKKRAQHLASTQVLNFIGFDFQYKEAVKKGLPEVIGRMSMKTYPKPKDWSQHKNRSWRTKITSVVDHEEYSRNYSSRRTTERGNEGCLRNIPPLMSQKTLFCPERRKCFEKTYVRHSRIREEQEVSRHRRRSPQEGVWCKRPKYGSDLERFC